MSMKSTLNKIAGWFQPAYNKLKAMKLPKPVDDALDAIWDNLSPAIQKAIWDFIKKIVKELGEDKAKAMLTTIVGNLQSEADKNA